MRVGMTLRDCRAAVDYISVRIRPRDNFGYRNIKNARALRECLENLLRAVGISVRANNEERGA